MTAYVKLPMYASFITLKGDIASESEDSYLVTIGNNRVSVLKSFVFADKECTTYFSYEDKYEILAALVRDYITSCIDYPEFNRKAREIIF